MGIDIKEMNKYFFMFRLKAKRRINYGIDR